MTTKKRGRKIGFILTQESKDKIGLANKGNIAWNKGKKGVQVGWSKGMTGVFSKETLLKMRMAKLGKPSNSFKLKRAGKSAMHKWVNSIKGKPNLCNICGTKDIFKTYDWANIDHKYNRSLNDYIRMCRSCHRKHDIKNNNYKVAFLTK